MVVEVSRRQGVVSKVAHSAQKLDWTGLNVNARIQELGPESARPARHQMLGRTQASNLKEERSSKPSEQLGPEKKTSRRKI